MKNNSKARYKLSKLEFLMNKSIIVVFLLQTTFALLGGGLGAAWLTQDNMLKWLD